MRVCLDISQSAASGTANGVGAYVVQIHIYPRESEGIRDTCAGERAHGWHFHNDRIAGSRIRYNRIGKDFCSVSGQSERDWWSVEWRISRLPSASVCIQTGMIKDN